MHYGCSLHCPSLGRTRSNLVYCATAKQWTNDEQRETEPSQAKWITSNNPKAQADGHPEHPEHPY